MGGDDLDDDEHVANLLKQDAQKTAKQYKMVGLDAFLPKKSSSAAPKPNTRFLRNLIRETDSHNTALLAKEAEESRARLRRLTREDEAKERGVGRLTPPDLADEERYDRKRKRAHHDEDPQGRNTRRREPRDRETASDTRSRRVRHEKDDRRRHKERYDDSGEEHSRRKSNHPSERWHKHGADEDTSRPHRKDEAQRTHRRRRSYSRSGSRSPSPPARKHHSSSKHRHRSRSRHRSQEPAHGQKSSKRTQDGRDSSRRKSPYPVPDDSDSDPLEAIVGPLPPAPAPAVRARGRGAHKVNSAAMDFRFSPAYDPATDVHLPSDVEDDWGDALEALKDRQRWKQQGADRLKAAGFSDDQVQRWAKGDDKTEEDVTWALKGEGREWDRGKVLDDDGDVTLKPEWGRLT